MDKNVIIFVNAIRPSTFEALSAYEQQSGRQFEPIVFVDETIKESIFECNGQNNLPEKVKVLTADFDSAASVRDALKPYEERIFAVTAQYENCVQELRRLLPYLPYIPTPTEKSLEWATEKKLMRKMMEAYDSSLVPQYLEVFDVDQVTIGKIEATIQYPLVVKPSGLEGSLLVNYVENREELEAALVRTFESMQALYDTWVKRQKPAVLVEEFMVGDMYTIDVHIDTEGKCYYTPVIGTIPGRKAGYEGFFSYKEFLPSDLSGDEEEKARQAASLACHALGLRSVTAHVEMMRTASGWKIIELGPRMGGDRHYLLDQAYGINHIVNDIRIRAGEVPDIPIDLQKNVTVIDPHVHKEGVLTAIHGIEETKNLPSFVHLRQNIPIGQPVLFAKNGSDPILSIVLSHANREQLDSDVATVEATIAFDVE